MAFQINSQYTKFVQFAEQQVQAGNKTAIARLAGDPLADRTITTATGDKVAPFWGRSRANKDANNDVRTLFRNTIVNMFGGEAHIPHDVKVAMLLKDYDCGKPLTARRIMAVKAQIDLIIAEHAANNAAIVTNITNKQFDQLPQDMRNGFAQAVDNFRTVFGEAAVPQGADISRILIPQRVTGDIRALCNAANAQGRALTAQEVVDAYVVKARERLVATTAGAPILAKLKALRPNVSFTELSIASAFETRHPGLFAEIRNCGNPEAIAAVLQQHEAEFNDFVAQIVRSEDVKSGIEDKAKAKLATAFGLDGRIVAAHFQMDELREQAKNLHEAIVKGNAPGSTEQGYDMQAAYDALVDEFVQKRIDTCAAIDSLDLPENARNRWKADYTAYREIPAISPAQLLQVVQSVNVGKIVSALGKGLPMSVAVSMLHNVHETICAAIRQATGNPNFFQGKGTDDLMPIYGMLIVAAEAKDPSLAPAIQKARATFFGPADKYCESDRNFALTSTFIRTLASMGGTVKDLPVTKKGAFLASVENAVESAFAECGITDDKVRKAVKGRMLERGKNVLTRATGLKRLSDFLATVKAEIAAIPAKQKDMVAKYSAGLSQETLPLLTRLVGVLDWRENAAAKSEEIVKNYAEDMKTWRNVAPGSTDAKGLEEVFQRRMDDYLKDVLAGKTSATFNTGKHPGLFQTFLDDLPRAKYVINGKEVKGDTLQERLVPFMDAIKDPSKRKAVSVMINQQLYGEYTTSIANRFPLVGWKAGMKDVPLDTIPGIDKFASRDLSKTGYQLFDTGPMEFAIEVAPDESTVTVHAKSEYPFHADVSQPTATIGTCTVTQDFVIDLTGPAPAIKNLQIGQTLA